MTRKSSPPYRHSMATGACLIERRHSINISLIFTDVDGLVETRRSVAVGFILVLCFLSAHVYLVLRSLISFFRRQRLGDGRSSFVIVRWLISCFLLFVSLNRCHQRHRDRVDSHLFEAQGRRSSAQDFHQVKKKTKKKKKILASSEKGNATVWRIIKKQKCQ